MNSNQNPIVVPPECVQVLIKALGLLDKIPLPKEERDLGDSILALIYNPKRNEKQIESLVSNYKINNSRPEFPGELKEFKRVPYLSSDLKTQTHYIFLPDKTEGSNFWYCVSWCPTGSERHLTKTKISNSIALHSLQDLERIQGLVEFSNQLKTGIESFEKLEVTQDLSLEEYYYPYKSAWLPFQKQEIIENVTQGVKEAELWKRGELETISPEEFREELNPVESVAGLVKFECWTSCPKCGRYFDLYEDEEFKRKVYGDNPIYNLREEDVNLDVQCSECNYKFLVSNIEY